MSTSTASSASSSTNLLQNAEFVRAARPVARSTRNWSRKLLKFADKAAVTAAVAALRQQHEAEVAARVARQATIAAEYARVREMEKPTREAVMTAYEKCGYRVCKQGHNTFVTVEAPFGQPYTTTGNTTAVRVDATMQPVANVTANTVRGERYSSRCTFAKNYSRHHITVLHDWLAAVHGRGLAVVEGRLCLTAEDAGHTKNGELVALARVVVQGRGTCLETETIFAARNSQGEWRSVKDAEVVQYTDPGIMRDALIDLGIIPQA